MARQRDRLEIDCDAPPYEIVHACESSGLRSPLDVRWRRLRHYLVEEAERKAVARGWPWLAVLGISPGEIRDCSCGALLPTLRPALFHAEDRVVAVLLLGQCDQCNTIYWEEP